MSEIISLRAREILDSRGNPTIEVECELESGAVGSMAVPSGASKGIHEAIEIKDGEKRYGGKGVNKAIRNVVEQIAKRVIGMDAMNQAELDKALIELDGTSNKSKLGANACVGVSLACADAQAMDLEIPLYRWLGGVSSCILPVPMLNIINGGMHADNNLSIQEFMLVPVGGENFKESIRMGAEIFHKLKELFKAKGLFTGVGDEGGLAPNLTKNRDACEFIVRAIEGAGYKPGKDAFIALDCAASSFYREGKYVMEERSLSSQELIDFYEDWVSDFPILSIEDGLAEDDWDGWSRLTQKLGEKILLVGDDLYVTNTERFKKGIEHKASNAILIKPNQTGTLTETLECIEFAKRAGFKYIISHRSGETESVFISHLAVGSGAGLIKAGGPCRGGRIAKYNELIRIEEELGEGARYLGVEAFNL